MSDNKNKKGPQDSQRINIGEEYEVQYWTKTLKVSKEVLERAVKKVGPMVNDVKKELGR